MSQSIGKMGYINRAIHFLLKKIENNIIMVRI